MKEICPPPLPLSIHYAGAGVEHVVQWPIWLSQLGTPHMPGEFWPATEVKKNALRKRSWLLPPAESKNLFIDLILQTLTHVASNHKIRLGRTITCCQFFPLLQRWKCAFWLLQLRYAQKLELSKNTLEFHNESCISTILKHKLSEVSDWNIN